MVFCKILTSMKRIISRNSFFSSVILLDGASPNNYIYINFIKVTWWAWRNLSYMTLVVEEIESLTVMVAQAV